MNECDNKTHRTNESNMLTIKRIQTGPTRGEYVPCVHFTAHHSTLQNICVSNHFAAINIYHRATPVFILLQIQAKKYQISQKLVEQFRHGS